MTGPAQPKRRASALERARALLADRDSGTVHDGYLDLRIDSVPPTASQIAMQSRWLPLIYERAWRPLGALVLAAGRTPESEARLTSQLLALGADDSVLDVACGPGNTTRRLLADLGPRGLAVGFDASATMLARAVADTHDRRTAYVRGNAERLPFRDGAFQAVSCSAALYLIDDPFAALDEMVRVLAPRGRIALLTSCHRGLAPLRPAFGLVSRAGGVRLFDRDAFTGALARHGFAEITQEIHGFAQFVGARKP